MGASVQPSDPVADYLKAHAAATQTPQAPAAPTDDPVSDYLAARAASAPSVPRGTPRVAPDVTAALPRNRPNPSGDLHAVSGVPDAVAAHVLSAAQAVPGMEAVEAGMGALGSHFPGQRPMSYTESLANLRGHTDQINPYVKVAEQTAASLPLLGTTAIARLTPTATGALMGGLSQAANADPKSAQDRILGTVLGTAGGATMGKLTDLAATGIRGLVAKRPDVNVVARDNARSASSATNYGNALANANPPTPAVTALINNQDFGPLAVQLERSPQFRGMARTDPRFLNEIYKGLSDESGALDKRMIAPDPARGNSARRQIGDIRVLKNQLLDALDATSSEAPAPAAPAATLPVRDASGRLRQNLGSVADEHLEQEWQRLAELNARENAMHGAVRDAGYRADYEELPRTEKLGHKGKEDLPDADGAIDPEILAADNKTIADFNKSVIVRQARERAMRRIEAELGSRPSATDFGFGANVANSGPVTHPPMMPGYRPAVQDYADQSGQIGAVQNGKANAARIITNKPVAAKDLLKKSPAAFERSIGTMTPSDAATTQEGVLGELGNHLGLSGNPFKLFGIPRVAGNVNRISPYVRQLDQQAGTTLPDLLAKLGIVAGTDAVRR